MERGKKDRTRERERESDSTRERGRESERGSKREGGGDGGREGEMERGRRGRERLAWSHMLFGSLMAQRADPFPRVLPFTARHILFDL